MRDIRSFRLISYGDAETIRHYQPAEGSDRFQAAAPTVKIMRILHTMLRVADLDKSLSFYTEVLGMNLLRKSEYPEGKFTLALLGYTDESDGTTLELTYNWGVDSYELGNAFGHIAIEVEDVYRATDQIRRLGGKILRDAGPVNSGAIISFIEDPDGYPIQLIGAK